VARWQRQQLTGLCASLCLLALAGIMPIAAASGPREEQVNQPTLDCALELTTRPDGNVDMTFVLNNATGDSVTVAYMAPFIDFSLTASADDGDVEIIQPMYNIGAQPIAGVIDPGESVRIRSPFHLQFGPAEPAQGDPMVWTLVHDPAPVQLEAAPRVQGATIATCTAVLEPTS